jgi:hypothetical protein
VRLIDVLAIFAAVCILRKLCNPVPPPAPPEPPRPLRIALTMSDIEWLDSINVCL